MPPKSNVWKYFVRQGKSSATCKLCNVTVETSRKTSNLWSHLLVRHKIRDTKSQSRETAARPASGASNNDDPDDPGPIDVEDGGTTCGQSPSPSISSTSAPTPPPNEGRVGLETAVLPSLTSLLGKRRRPVPSDTGVQPLQQITLESSFQKVASFKEGGTRDADSRDALLYMMMKENLPLSFPRSEGFLYYVSKTTPLWTPPSRQTITRQMEMKYETAAELVKRSLMELSSVCLTADTWTDSHTTKSYLGMTVHFLVGTTMESACIGLMKLDKSHTGLYLADKMLEFCDTWGIKKERVSMVIVDNAENIKLAVKTAFGQNKMLNCFNHTLNLIPKYALGNKSDKDQTPYVAGVPQLIRKMKDIVTFSHTSSNFANELQRIQIERFSKTEGTALRLLQDVKTRWGSTFTMIERFVALSDVPYLVTAQFPEVDMLTAAELATHRAIMKVLEPFNEATVEMGAEKYTTASKVIPVVYLILKAIQDCEVPMGSNDTVLSFKNFCVSEVKRRFGDVEFNRPLAVATILDPRFIKAYFKSSEQSPRAVADAVSFIEEEIRQDMRADTRGAFAAIQEEIRDAPSTSNLREVDSSGKKGLWASHNERVRSANVATSTDDILGRARSEMHGYMNRELLPVSTDPIQAWEKLKPLYPHLYKVARRHLSILVTSVSAERLFSKVSFISTDETSRLTSEHLSQRVFLASINKELWEAASVPK